MIGRGVSLQGGWVVNNVAFLASRVDLYSREQDVWYRNIIT